jgi:DNA mismatch repair protein MutS2
VLINPAALESLEFDAVREMCARRCASPLGESRARTMSPFDEPGLAEEALAETTEARELIEEAGRPPLALAGDPREALARLEIEGALLDTAEVGLLVSLCAACSGARLALAGGGGGRWPLLARRGEALPDLRSLVTLIEPHLGPAGEIHDSASPELRRLRQRAARLTARVNGLLESILKRPAADQFLSDRFITERGGRHVIPVRVDSPSAPRGIVHGVSSSGVSVFLEPLETIELNNELVQVRERESAEIERILADWTGRLAGRLEELRAAAEEIGELDVAFARASLARDQNAVRPALESAEGLRVTGGRHPILEQTLDRRGESVVPLSLDLDPGEKVLVISGPNTGGKTVALKTIGLLAAMAHAGLHVPADRFDLPLIRQVLVDIGDRQSITASLSTFSAHIANIASMLKTLEPSALVLLDEIGTGTDPDEGAALAAALLEHLMARGAMAVVTTHHGALKAWAYSTPGVANAAVEFDEERLEPTYRLRAGVAGASSGLAIAVRLGIDPAVIDSAKERLSPAARESETLLRRLREMLATADRDREEASRLKERLDREREHHARTAAAEEAKRHERFTRETEAVLEAFHRKSAGMLARVKDRRERQQLDRERARREAELRRAVAEEMQRMGIGTTRKGAGGEGERLVSAGELRPGVRVFVEPLGRHGVVEESDGERVTVRIGTTRTRVRLSECRATDERRPTAEALPTGVTAEFASREDVPGEILLIGMTVEEALARLDKFLDDAFLAGRGQVRVIHGHGSGRLRGAVRKFLDNHPHVDSHRAGAAAEGGSGATVARLKS